MRLLALLIVTTTLSACAHSGNRNDADPQAVKTAAEQFHKRVRWKDFSSASNLLVPERRGPFLAAREKLRDERDLTISDYELLEIRLEPDGTRAEVVSRISWSRLPSLTENADTLVTELYPFNGLWLIARQTKGPFTPELEEAYQPPSPGPKP